MEEETKKDIPIYAINRMYRLQKDLEIFEGPSINSKRKRYFELSNYDKDHCRTFKYSDDCKLLKGTKIFTIDVRSFSNSVWIQIQSGWVCAYYNGNKNIS